MLEALRHVVQATGHSIAGFSHLFSREIAARIELAVSAAALAWLVILRSSAGEILFFVLLSCMLVSVEALNTCIELLTDHISPQRSALAKSAKDLGSLAVFLMLIAGGVYLVVITGKRFGLITLW